MTWSRSPHHILNIKLRTPHPALPSLQVGPRIKFDHCKCKYCYPPAGGSINCSLPIVIRITRRNTSVWSLLSYFQTMCVESEMSHKATLKKNKGYFKSKKIVRYEPKVSVAPVGLVISVLQWGELVVLVSKAGLPQPYFFHLQKCVSRFHRKMETHTEKNLENQIKFIPRRNGLKCLFWVPSCSLG